MIRLLPLPWLVLSCAAQVHQATPGALVRVLEQAAGMEGPQTIQLAAGTYRLTQPLLLDHRFDGLSLEALPEATVIFSGAEGVEGDWEASGDGIQTIRVGTQRVTDVYREDRRLPRAREPDAAWFRIESAAPDKRTGLVWREGDVPPALVRPEGLEVFFLHDWSTSRVAVKSLDPVTRTLTTTHAIGCAATHYRITHFEAHPRYRLVGHEALMDEPGEWVHHPERGLLRLMGTPAELAGISVPRLQQLLRVEGATNITFRGITFAHTRWVPPAGGYASGQAGFHEYRDGRSGRAMMPAAVEVADASGIRFEACRFTHLGACGLWFGARCRDGDVRGCRFDDIAGNALLIGEDRPREPATSHIDVRDCVVEHCGVRYPGSVGIWIGLAHHISVRETTLRHLPYTGISVGWRWNPSPSPCHDNLIASNHIHHVMQVLSDGGGIYTLGRQPGTRLIGNEIHDIPINLGRAESNGMFLDQGSTDLLIEDNLIYRTDKSSLRFHQATTNQVRNNVFVLEEGVPEIRYNRTRPEDIRQRGNRRAGPDELPVLRQRFRSRGASE